MEHTVVIDRPPPDVFAYLTDVERLPEWQSSARDVHAEGDIGLGARIHEVRSLLGQRAESTLEVTEYEQDRTFALRVVSGPLSFKVRHTLTPEDGGTRLDWVGEADTSRFTRRAVRIAAGAIQWQFKADLERLKRLLETSS